MHKLFALLAVLLMVNAMQASAQKTAKK